MDGNYLLADAVSDIPWMVALLCTAVAGLAGGYAVIGRWLRMDVIELRARLDQVQTTIATDALRSLTETADELRIVRQERADSIARFTAACEAFDSAISKHSAIIQVCERMSTKCTPEQIAKHVAAVLDARERTKDNV